MDRPNFIAPLAAVALSALVACGGPQTPQATQAFCQSLTQLNTAVSAAQSVTASTPVNQAKDAASSVQKAWDTTKKAGADLHEARMNDLQQAYDDYQKTINSIPGSTTLGDAATQVAAATVKLRQTSDAIFTSVKCK